MPFQVRVIDLERYQQDALKTMWRQIPDLADDALSEATTLCLSPIFRPSRALVGLLVTPTVPPGLCTVINLLFRQ